MSKLSIIKLCAVAALIALVVPATAFGQATRTWVSGVGNDANPCSRTAPCKTYAGAIVKTARNGIIDTLDPGGFGTLTITKSITVDGSNTLGGVLAAGGINGFTINITDPADTQSKVILRGLDIEGTGGVNTRGLNGVSIVSAKVVRIEDSKIFQFSRNGVNFVPTTSNARLVVQNTTINDNGGNGLLAAPNASPAGNGDKVTIKNSQLTDNACGATASSTGVDGAFNFAVNCGAGAAGVGTRVAINSFDSLFSDNTFIGLLAKGSQATQRFGRCEISANATGIQATDAGADTQSYTGTNLLGNNTVNGVPTSFLPPV